MEIKKKEFLFKFGAVNLDNNHTSVEVQTITDTKNKKIMRFKIYKFHYNLLDTKFFYLSVENCLYIILKNFLYGEQSIYYHFYYQSYKKCCFNLNDGKNK